MTSEMEERREARRRFLRRLYERADADVNAYEDGHEIAAELGIPEREAERFTRYFEEHGYVQNVSSAGLTLRITAAGIDSVERGG